MIAATRIVHEDFADRNRLGLLRLRAGVTSAGLKDAEIQIDEFVDALAELFPR